MSVGWYQIHLIPTEWTLSRARPLPLHTKCQHRHRPTQIKYGRSHSCGLITDIRREPPPLHTKWQHRQTLLSKTLHNTLNEQQLTTHTGRHRRRNTLDSGPWAPAAVSKGNNSGLKKLFLLEANTVEKQSVG